MGNILTAPPWVLLRDCDSKIFMMKGTFCGSQFMEQKEKQLNRTSICIKNSYMLERKGSTVQYFFLRAKIMNRKFREIRNVS